MYVKGSHLEFQYGRHPVIWFRTEMHSFILGMLV